ncbi:helix-turn-helix domain-containing protein [Nonomuraea sp. LP-02]|uniref:PucR family transcriptional regulator n=1 Tax=Nonomuraea sp. LP-02 TaxID=3097960 RepID=UPI002E30BCAD|nr:helix-turn-helix domain-containing protein [Nonomuraea sp. LP-02]MED7925691.1 helix-turn-helix domain-containing protein [Nonomuraea sp. LP-02]
MRIRDLLDIPGLRLRLLTGDPDREFATVHITDLPEPGRYLSGGELVLTGLMWRQAPEDSARFVTTLAEAGVAAVGAGAALLGHVPDDLVAACAAAGLPLLEVPTEVSFRTLTELAAPRPSGDVRAALGRHRRLVAAVAEGADLRELFELAAAELGVTGAVVTASGHVVVGTVAEPGEVARAYLTAPRLPARAHGRTIFAVGRGHRAAGWALALDGDLLDRADLGYELAACVGLERMRVEEGRRVERRLAEQLVVAALAGADPAELNARLRTCGLDAAEPYAVVDVTAPRPGATRGPDPATLGGQVVEELLGREVVAAAGADGAVAVVPLRGSTAGELAARLRAAAEVLSALPGTRVCAGLSGALTGAAALKGGVEEAGHARRLAEARGGGVVTSDEIYTHALLLATVPAEVRRSFADRLLSPLLDYDRRHQSELVRTLGVFLDCAGSWNACAERLHVHVNTVRYRVRRIEELTGRNLATMADRVDFYLALRDTAPPR